MGEEKQKYLFQFVVVALWLLRLKCSSCSASSGISGEVGMSSRPLVFAKGKRGGKEMKREKQERKKREKKKEEKKR